MSKEQLASRLLSAEALIEGTKLRIGKLNDEEWDRLIPASDILGKSELYLDDSPGITITEMKSKLRRMRKLDLVIIDYLQLMGSGRRIDNRVQEISEITRNLKILAKEMNVPVITLSQLSRASEQRTDTDHSFPTCVIRVLSSRMPTSYFFFTVRDITIKTRTILRRVQIKIRVSVL